MIIIIKVYHVSSNAWTQNMLRLQSHVVHIHNRACTHPLGNKEVQAAVAYTHCCQRIKCTAVISSSMGQHCVLMRFEPLQFTAAGKSNLLAENPSALTPRLVVHSNLQVLHNLHARKL